MLQFLIRVAKKFLLWQLLSLNLLLQILNLTVMTCHHWFPPYQLFGQVYAGIKNVFFMSSMFSQVPEATDATGEDGAGNAAERAMKAQHKQPPLTGFWECSSLNWICTLQAVCG